MSTDETLVRANDAFFDDDYDEALTLYTQVIQNNPDNAEAVMRRCTVYQKTNDLEKALADATKALEILNGPKGTRTLLARANLQKGIVLFNLKKYKDAQEYLETAKTLNPNERTLATWLRKVEDVLPPPPVAQPVAQPTAAAASSSSTAPNPPPAAATPQSARARHEWFQNDTFVTVEVFIKNVKKDTVDLGFFDKSLSLTIKMANGSDYSLELDPLAHEIEPKESSFKVLSTKIEIKLKKKTEGIKWGALEGEDEMATAMASSSGSSARQVKDWDKLARDIEKDTDKPEGDAALNTLFQQIYSGADDDAKRAMMKSFVESNGTCLSTNWSEVGTKKTETKPPEGMVARKYEI